MDQEVVKIMTKEERPAGTSFSASMNVEQETTERLIEKLCEKVEALKVF